jgi:trans-aconitate methyltransferase
VSRDIERYARDYLDDYGFEATLVRYRRRLLLERLHEHRPDVVVEVGCGAELLYAGYLQAAAPVATWVTVEPAPAFAAQARAANLPGAVVVEGLLEAALPQVRAALPRAPDLVLCSGLLHEVADVAPVLAAMHALMDARSVLHVNVPNATSQHRRLAVAMGLVPALDSLGERNLRLQQHRVFDAPSLAATLAGAGFAVQATGGHFVKPFTHAQMQALADVLEPAVLDGLYALGRAEPDWACEIFAEARRAEPRP